jgi:uncharacterized coiled-coil DUF342 family protein
MLTVYEMILSFALIGVLGGWAMGRIGSWFGNRSSRTREEELNHRVRALEADLRVAQRKADEATAQAEQHRQELETLRGQMHTESSAIRERDEQLKKLRQELIDECTKTQGLRQELTSRAEETIRARAKVKEVETELGVARAGSDAVIEEVQRLAAERAELTGRLQTMQAELGGKGKSTATVTRLPLRDTVTEG